MSAWLSASSPAQPKNVPENVLWAVQVLEGPGVCLWPQLQVRCTINSCPVCPVQDSSGRAKILLAIQEMLQKFCGAALVHHLVISTTGITRRAHSCLFLPTLEQLSLPELGVCSHLITLKKK